MNSDICVIGSSGNIGSKHLNKLCSQYNTVGWDILFDDEQVFWDKIVPKYNNFIIATPNSTHYYLSQRLIELNKNLLVEKPICTSYKDAQTLLRLSKQYNTVLMVGHVYRYNPDFQKALPELYHVPELEFKMVLPHNNQLEDIVMDLLSHGLELCFNLGQRDFSRDFELLDCIKNVNNVFVKARIGSKNCSFIVGYNSDHDTRTLTGFDAWGNTVTSVDFHDADGKSPDSMENLHQAFMKACNVGIWQHHYAENAVAAIQLCEQVQKELFK